eukprot:XP_001700916.1 predicted protein [Chlamydomonas reinhardtii]
MMVPPALPASRGLGSPSGAHGNNPGGTNPFSPLLERHLVSRHATAYSGTVTAVLHHVASPAATGVARDTQRRPGTVPHDVYRHSAAASAAEARRTQAAPGCGRGHLRRDCRLGGGSSYMAVEGATTATGEAAGAAGQGGKGTAGAVRAAAAGHVPPGSAPVGGAGGGKTTAAGGSRGRAPAWAAPAMGGRPATSPACAAQAPGSPSRHGGRLATKHTSAADAAVLASEHAAAARAHLPPSVRRGYGGALTPQTVADWETLTEPNRRMMQAIDNVTNLVSRPPRSPVAKAARAGGGSGPGTGAGAGAGGSDDSSGSPRSGGFGLHTTARARRRYVRYSTDIFPELGLSGASAASLSYVTSSVTAAAAAAASGGSQILLPASPSSPTPSGQAGPEHGALLHGPQSHQPMPHLHHNPYANPALVQSGTHAEHGMQHEHSFTDGLPLQSDSSHSADAKPRDPHTPAHGDAVPHAHPDLDDPSHDLHTLADVHLTTSLRSGSSSSRRQAAGVSGLELQPARQARQAVTPRHGPNWVDSCQSSPDRAPLPPPPPPPVAARVAAAAATGSSGPAVASDAAPARRSTIPPRNRLSTRPLSPTAHLPMPTHLAAAGLEEALDPRQAARQAATAELDAMLERGADYESKVKAASRATKALARAPGAAGPAAGAPSSPTSPHLAMKVLQPRSSADMAVAAGGGGLEVLAAPVPAAAEMEAMRAAARVTVAAPPVSLANRISPQMTAPLPAAAPLSPGRRTPGGAPSSPERGRVPRPANYQHVQAATESGRTAHMQDVWAS